MQTASRSDLRAQWKQHKKEKAATQTPPRAFRRAISFVGVYKALTLFAVCVLCLATLAQLAVPQILQIIINTATYADTAGELEVRSAQAQVFRDTGFIVIFALSWSVLSFAQSYAFQKLGQHVAFDMRNALFNKIQRLSLSYHDRNQTGKLMVRAVNDVEGLRIFIGEGLLLAGQACLLLVGILVILYLTNPQLTFIILPILPLTVVLYFIFGAIVQSQYKKGQRCLARMNVILHENLAGLKLVKTHAKEAYEERRFEASLEDLLKHHLAISRALALLLPVILLIANFGQTAIVLFGGRSILLQQMTLGEWQKFTLYLAYLLMPLGQLGFVIALTARARTSAGRIYEVLDADNEVEEKADALTLSGIDGRVVFDDVSFCYFAGSDPVLKNINFVVEPGQTVALLGATGSGKTSIVNLIPRFYDVASGTVCVDDYDVRDLTLESLRSHIGVVLQETILLRGTIRENIAFGRATATDEEIVAVAKAAAAHDFIRSFPDGYETAVSERGATLSGGQRQRIAIARALLINPQILILDDFTSNVDLQTEAHIQKALAQLMEGRTCFVIAQRASTTVNADKILLLDQGQIVATGTHEALLEQSPLYVDLFYSQMIED